MAATPAATEQQEIVVKESFEELQSEFTDTALERITLDSVVSSLSFLEICLFVCCCCFFNHLV